MSEQPTQHPGVSPVMKDRAKQQFDAWADTYDRSILNHFLFRPAYLATMEEIAQWRQSNPRPFRVLDIGCGTGTLAMILAESPWDVTVVGMDYSPAMCVAGNAKARQTGLADVVQFVAGDSEHLPFADGSFDIVNCSNSFHHYPHQEAVVREMRRVLAPGGWAILIDGFRDNVVGWFVFDVIISTVEGGVHHAPWTAVRDHFDAAGFTAVRRRKINFWMPLLVTVGQV